MTDEPWHPTQLPPGPDNMNSWLYWEIALAAGAADSQAERDRIWRYWDFERYGDPMGIGAGSERTGGMPQSGYWRTKIGPKGERKAVPVAIWWEIDHSGGRLTEYKLCTLVAGKPPKWEIRWEYLSGSPLTKAQYDFWIANGYFEGEVQTQAPRFDHNAENPYAQLRDDTISMVGQIERELRRIGGGVFDRVTADKLGNWAGMVSAAAALCKDTKTKETADLTAALAHKRELWSITLTALEETAARIKKLLTPYLQEQAEIGAKTTVGGQSGRSISLRRPYVAVIDDYDAALTALREHPAIRDTVLRIAGSRAKAKVKEPIPGVRYVQEGKAV